MDRGNREDRESVTREEIGGEREGEGRMGKRERMSTSE